MELLKKLKYISHLTNHDLFLLEKGSLTFGDSTDFENIFNEQTKRILSSVQNPNKIFFTNPKKNIAFFSLTTFPTFTFIVHFNISDKFQYKNQILTLEFCNSIAQLVSEESLTINTTSNIEKNESNFINLDSDLINGTSENAENKSLHHSYETEKYLFSFISRGDITGINDYFYFFTSSELNEGLLSTSSQLRHEKNILITLVTLSTRAAIEGGVFYDKAYELSDWWIQKIETLNNLESILDTNMRLKILISFTEQVRKYDGLGNVPIYTKTRNYILDNIYEKIDVTDLSKIFNYNKDYYIKIFKFYSKKTPYQLVLDLKIEESKNLLEFTDNSLLEIAMLLKFNDYSHFAKVFKRIEGCTPKKYRFLKAM